MAIEVARPPASEPVLDRRRMNLVFVTVLLGMLLAALDQTIVSTALPTIVGDLGGAGHLTWIVSSYLLADTIATVLAGKFGDLFGRKLRDWGAADDELLSQALNRLAIRFVNEDAGLRLEPAAMN
jgi:MFS family permease